jgi:hypothetical protein
MPIIFTSAPSPVPRPSPFSVLHYTPRSPTLGVSHVHPQVTVPAGLSGDIRRLKYARDVRGVQSKDNKGVRTSLLYKTIVWLLRESSLEPGIDRGSVTQPSCLLQ